MGYLPHALVQFGGSLLGSSSTTYDEIWTSGVRVEQDGTNFLADCDAYIAAIRTPLATWFGAALTAMSHAARLEWLKVNNIDPDGTYHDPTTHQYVYPSPTTGATTVTMPPFVTARATFTTGVARGLANKGGIWLPFAIAPTISSKLASGDQTSILNASKALLTLIKTSSPLIAPFVESRGKAIAWDDHHRPTAWSAGARQLIGGVRVGDVMDVRRSRKEQLHETYVSVAFP